MKQLLHALPFSKASDCAGVACGTACRNDLQKMPTRLDVFTVTGAMQLLSVLHQKTHFCVDDDSVACLMTNQCPISSVCIEARCTWPGTF